MMLNDMLPAPAIPNALNARRRKTELLRQFWIGVSAGEFSNLSNDICVDLRPGMIFASCIFTLSSGIFGVFFRCPQEQMRGIYTGRIIATVANVDTGRNLSEVNHPRNSVCAPVLSLIPQSSVILAFAFATLATSKPFPTAGRWLNFGQKPLAQIGGRIFGRHVTSCFRLRVQDR